jgi:hypothetical protein
MDQDLEDWTLHVKSLVIQNMKCAIETLSYENLPDYLFVASMQSLQNGIRFLANKREEK